MNEILKNLNYGIQDLHPYEPGRSIDEVINEFKLDKVIKLASNENPLGASPKALKVLNEYASNLHLYPDGDSMKLKKAISKNENININQIIIGNGSNEILELSARAFLNKNSSAVMSRHAFAVYKLVSKACGSEIREVPMSNWRHDLGRFKDFIDETTKICFIANPNNPTGTYNTHDEVKKLLDETPKSVLVVLDLAYFEYVEKNDYVRVNELLSEFNNLLVTRTFSKIQGLASLRIGYGIASEELIEVLNRIRQPFNSNYIAQEAATIAISDKEHISKSISLNKEERKRIQNENVAKKERKFFHISFCDICLSF